MKLKGRNAIITGASQGLGREIAAHYLQAGANVALCARDAPKLAGTVADLEKDAPPGVRIVAQACDVSNEADVNAFVDFAREELGAIDILVANAGIYGPMGPTESVALDEWRRALEINLFGVLLPCRALIPHFKEHRAGSIVVISGGGATNPMPNVSAYASSKAAVVRLVETLAGELEPFGISVNAIAPGALKTRMNDEVLAAGPEKVGRKFYEQNKKWAEDGATPLEFGAKLAVYLGSDESAKITGRLLSARWDPWATLHERAEELAASDIYCLRRIVPADRGRDWDAL